MLRDEQFESNEITYATKINMLRTENSFELFELMNAGYVVAAHSPYQVYHPDDKKEVCRCTSALFDYVANQTIVVNRGGLNGRYLSLIRGM